MKLKKIMALVLAFMMVLGTMNFSVLAEDAYIAKVGDVECADANEMLSALRSASGEVTVEIYGKLETNGFGLNNPSIEKLSFVGMTDDAEICVDGISYIDVRYTNYPIEYTGLVLSHTNAGQNIDGFLPQYFSTYNGGNVVYNECTFPNGVTAGGSAAGTTYTFNGCTFNNTTSGLYSLWVYGNSTNVVVNGGEFCGVRGIKMYSEGSDDFSSLSVSGATFSDTITEKHAIVLTKGESITLTGSTFNNTKGIVDVDGDFASFIEGKTVTIDGTEYIVDSENITLEEVTPPVETVLAQTKDINGNVIEEYADFESALAAACADNSVARIEILGDITQSPQNLGVTYNVAENQDLTIGVPENEEYTVDIIRTIDDVDGEIKSFSIYLKNNNSSLTIGEGLTIKGLDILADGFATSDNELIINGTLYALSLKEWTNNNGITINKTGKVVLGYGDGQFDLAYGDGYVTINGNGNETEPQFKAGYSGTRGNGNTLNLNDTYFESGRDFNVAGSNGTFNIDNSLLKISGGDFAGELKINSTGNTFNLTNGSTIDVANLSLGADNKITIDGKSQIKVKKLTGNGSIELDAATMTAASTPIVGDASEFTGSIELINNDELKVEIDDNGNIVLVEVPTPAGPVLSGSGTEADPYVINNIDDLKAFRDDVNAGNTYKGEYVALKADINLTDEVWTPIGTSSYDVAPTDSDVKMFAGNFDGGNHTITGLTSEDYVPAAEDISSGEYSFGLFGYVYGANISNVKLEDVNIDGTTRKDSEGDDVVGSGVAALIGYYVIADEKACVIDNCHVLGGTVKATNNMGGLIGYMDAQSNILTADITIKNCTNAAEVTTDKREAGGILGLLNHDNAYGPASMYGNITFLNCSNTGDITALDGAVGACAGGILGRDATSHNYKNVTVVFDTCSNSGNITVHTNGESHAAGLGTVFYSDSSWLVIKNSINTGNITATESGDKVYVGGLMAYAGVATIENSTSTGTVTVGGENGNTYIGSAAHTLFLNEMDDFADTIGGTTYYLNGGTAPEIDALYDDSGNYHLVETAYKDGMEFVGWYDNANFNGAPYTALSSSVKTYYAKWNGPVAKIGNEEFDTLWEAVEAAQDGDVIVVTADHKMLDTVMTNSGYPAYINVDGKSITIDLNGKKITATPNNLDKMLIGAFYVHDNSNLVLIDSSENKRGSVSLTKGENAQIYSLLTTWEVASTATIEGGNYFVDIVDAGQSMIYTDLPSSITIKGGIFTLGNLGSFGADKNYGPWMVNVGGQNEGSVVVEGGTFNAEIGLEYWAFETKIADGKGLKDNGDGTWSVVDAVADVEYELWHYPDYNFKSHKLGFATIEEAAVFANEVCSSNFQEVLERKNPTITLLETVESEGITLTGDITLDLNEKTLNGAIKPSTGDITVKNGSIVNTNADVSGIEITSGKLTLENVNIDSARHAVRIDGVVEAVIDGGTYRGAIRGTKTLHAVNASGGANVTIESGNFYGPQGTAADSGAAVMVQAGTTVTIKGGNYSGGKNNTLATKEDANLTVYGGTFDQDPKAYLADGYTTTVENGTYTVKEGVVRIDETYYVSLADAVANAKDNETITVIKDIADCTAINVSGKNIALDLNGKTISGVCNTGSGSLIQVKNGAKLTIKDSSTEQTGKITYAPGTSNTGWTIYNEGNLVLESGTLELTGDWSIGYAVDVRPNAWGTAYTEETSFVMDGGKIVSSDGAVRVASSSADTYKDIVASFTMNGGEIEAAYDGVFVQQSNAVWDVLNVTINDGTINAGLSPVRFLAPAATSYVNGEDCVDIALNGGTLTYTGTEELEWLVDGILCVGGGVTTDEFMKDASVTASASFAAANKASAGYEWKTIGSVSKLFKSATSATVRAFSDTPTVKAGDEVVVQVIAEGFDFTNGDWELRYDPTMFELDSAKTTYYEDSAKGVKAQSVNSADENTLAGEVIAVGGTLKQGNEIPSGTVLATYTFTVLPQSKDTVTGKFDIVNAHINTYDYAISQTNVPAVPVDFDITITREGRIITGSLDVAPLTYNGDIQKGNAFVVSDSVVGKDDAVITYSKTEDGIYTTELPTFKEAGSYSIWVKVNVDGYAEYKAEHAYMVIGAKDITLSLEVAAGAAYNKVDVKPVITGVFDAEFKGTLTISGVEGSYTKDDFIYMGNGLAIAKEARSMSVNAGSNEVTITYTQASTDNYANATETITVKAEKAFATQTIVDDLNAAADAAVNDIYYNGTEHKAQDKIVAPEGWSVEVTRISDGAPNPGVTDVADKEFVEIRFTHANYNDVVISRVLKVEALDLTIIVPDFEKGAGEPDNFTTKPVTYTSSNFVPSAEFTTLEELVATAGLNVVIVRKTFGEGDGKYVLTATYTPNDNYDIVVDDGKLTIGMPSDTKIEVVNNMLNGNGNSSADYVAGYKLVLVYTNTATARYTYDDKQMFDLSNAGYEYFDNTKSIAEQTEDNYKYVYGIIVKAEGNADDAYYADKVDFVGTNKYKPEKIVYDADVNYDNIFTNNDTSSANSVLNVEYELDAFTMYYFLKADYDRTAEGDFKSDKMVKLFDVQEVQKFINTKTTIQ